MKSQKSRFEKTISRFTIKTKTLCKAEGNTAAIVSAEPTTVIWNLLQVYFAEMLSPVLGDTMYGYRVKTVMGKRIKISHANSPNAYDVGQRLPPWVFNQLGLKLSDEGVLPVHIHLFRTSILDFYGKGKHLKIHAPLPPYFKMTAESLKLPLRYDQWVETDEIQYKTIAHNKADKPNPGDLQSQ